MEATTETLQRTEALLEPWRERMQTPEPDRIYLSIGPDELLDVVRTLHDARWGYLSTISGIDPSAEDSEMEVLYHFVPGRSWSRCAWPCRASIRRRPAYAASFRLRASRNAN